MFSSLYLSEVARIATLIEPRKVESIVEALKRCRDDCFRVFVIGLGGSAANASHMVNDLRKLCDIEAYAPTDNVSEVTARTNDSDDGWDNVFRDWLLTSHFCEHDVLFVLSVGGGNEDLNVSMPIVRAVYLAKMLNATVCAVVGREDGYVTTLRNLDTILVVPAAVIQPSRVTPHTEEFQAVIWHSIVSHPSLQINKTKW